MKYIDNMCDISIIIVNYNTCALTINCIKAIREKTQGVSYEIIIVDNASSDNSVLEIRKTDPDVTIIESSENLGFGKANNLAASKSRGNYLFFLNSDTILVNDAASILKSYLDSNPKVGICGGNLYDQNLQPNHSHLKVFPSIFNDIDLATRRFISKVLYKNMQFNHTESPIEVAYITGADLMISNWLFNEVGGFDPDFFLYFEETEMTYRVHRKGYKVVNVPSAKIIHLEGKSSNITLLKMQIMQKSRLLFFKKCYSRLYNIIASLNYLFINLISVCVCFLFNKQEAERLLNKIRIFIDLVKG